MVMVSGTLSFMSISEAGTVIMATMIMTNQNDTSESAIQ